MAANDTEVVLLREAIVSLRDTIAQHTAAIRLVLLEREKPSPN